MPERSGVVRGTSGHSKFWLPVAALAVAVAGLHLLTGWHSEGPVVFDDEGGYLRIARHLAGEGPVAGVKYFPGYSLLITPIHWALGSTGAIFNGVKVLNAALGAATALLTYLASGHLLPRDQRWRRLGASALVSLYSSYLLFSNQAFSENLLIPLSMLLAYLIARQVPEHPSVPKIVGLGVLAAYAVVVHPRAIGAVIALSVIVLTWWRPWSGHARRFIALGGAVGLTGLTGLLLLLWERSAAPSGSGTYNLGDLLDERLALGGLADIAVGGAGQLLYLITATGGLAVLAGIELAVATRRVLREGDRSSRAAFAMYAGITFLVVFATSAFFISPREVGFRPDAAIYGRYNEGMLAPVLLLGTTSLLSGRYRLWDGQWPWRSALPWLAGIAIVTAGVLELWQRDELFRVDFVNPFNVLALYPILVSVGGVDPRILAALATGVGGALLAVGRWGRWGPWAAVGLAVVAFAGLSVRMAFFYLPRDHYDVRKQERVVAETVNAIDEDFDIDCLGIDRVESPTYHFQLYTWYIDDVRLDRFSSDWSEPPCGSLVASSRSDLDDSYPGAELVVREGNGIESYLWVLPGPLQERLRHGGHLS